MGITIRIQKFLNRIFTTPDKAEFTNFAGISVLGGYLRYAIVNR